MPARTLQVSLKVVLVAVGLFTGLLGALATFHTTWVIPAILNQAREQTEALIERHGKSLHPNYVTRAEFSMVLGRLDKFEETLDRRLSRIENKLDMK